MSGRVLRLMVYLDVGGRYTGVAIVIGFIYAVWGMISLLFVSIGNTIAQASSKPW